MQLSVDCSKDDERRKSLAVLPPRGRAYAVGLNKDTEVDDDRTSITLPSKSAQPGPASEGAPKYSIVKSQTHSSDTSIHAIHTDLIGSKPDKRSKTLMCSKHAHVLLANVPLPQDPGRRDACGRMGVGDA